MMVGVQDAPDAGAGPADGADPARLDEDARRRRLDLLAAHQRLTVPVAGIGDAELDELIDLTDDVLRRERALARVRDERERAAGSQVVVRNALVLGAGSALLLAVGPVTGWWTAAGAALLWTAAIAAVVVLAGHALGPPTGHAARRRGSWTVLAAGAAVLAVAPEWPPWWLRVAVVAGLLVAVALFLLTFGTRPARDGAGRA
jgi:hypothetical protein